MNSRILTVVSYITAQAGLAVTLYTCIRAIIGPNLNRNSRLSWLRAFVVFLSLWRQMYGEATAFFFSNFSQFIIHQSSYYSVYTVQLLTTLYNNPERKSSINRDMLQRTALWCARAEWECDSYNENYPSSPVTPQQARVLSKQNRGTRRHILQAYATQQPFSFTRSSYWSCWYVQNTNMAADTMSVQVRKGLNGKVALVPI
jgi:hypothetical protein